VAKGFFTKLGISYWFAWTMLRKIRKAMGQQDANYRLDGLVEMDEGYFGGISLKE
jgi:molybdenum-dependent DNA-binding transcriptional regulator ModE